MSMVTGDPTDAVTGELQPTERQLLDRLMEDIASEEPVTLLLGSGLGGTVSPRVQDIVRLADQYATGRGDGGDLVRALAQAKRRLTTPSPTAVYAEYRRVFAAWVSGSEFDVIAQQAVLEAYRPTDRRASPLANHAVWQPVSLKLGEDLENDARSWHLSSGIEAVGAILTELPERFGNRVLTTSFDPLIEVGVRSANGKAASVPVGTDGSYDESAGQDGTIPIYHLHGFWRPTLSTSRDSLLHDPAALSRAPLVESTSTLINADTVCVLGTSDFAGTIVESLRLVARRRPLRILWAVHREDPEAAQRLLDHLTAVIGGCVECFVGIDADVLLTTLSSRLSVALTQRAAGPHHRTRHPTWERQLVSWPDAAPPEDIARLVRQLERRFSWGFRPGEVGRPTVLFWPVKLQPRASVIHMVQAVVAGALASRDMRLVVTVDDFGNELSDPVRARFETDLRRWVACTGPGIDVPFVSLSDFVAEQRRNPTPEGLLRPVDPWTVAQDLLGRHNPSVFNLLVAIKVVPNFGLRELAEDPAAIVQALLRNNANRLLTPLMVWPFLHHLLRNEPSAAVMTLGGWDEGAFWEQWRQVYGLGISQLYNPHFPSLSHRSELVHWSTRDELSRNLIQMRDLAGWENEGSYVPWLFQNAFLLPMYLTKEHPPEVDGSPLDSWAAFLAAIQDHQPVLELMGERVSALYLGAQGAA
jgi:hypothetical protein